MITKVLTATVIGVEAVLVEVEVAVANGLPATIIVGLPDTAIQESRERVRSAIKQTSFDYPQARVSVNLAPADLPKVGTHFDLPIALGILKSAGLISVDLEGRLFAGELAFDATLRPCKGVLSMALTAKKLGFKEIYVPKASAEEAALVKGILVYSIDDLNQLINHLVGREQVEPTKPTNLIASGHVGVDLKDVAGQTLAKRAIEIAVAGAHNIRFIGPPGSGKTMLANAMSGILPPLSTGEQLELTNLYSVAGLLSGGVVTQRPVRSPHHTMSAIALIGGGAVPKPGEVSLSHLGILFMDELPEFNRNVLEVLRQPLEDGRVTISRVRQTFTFPSKFILVTAQNPCPCGNFGDALLHCRCMPNEVQKYNRKVSGPLLDRIDLHVNVPRMSYQEVVSKHESESSEEVRARVMAARKVQTQRFNGDRNNSRMTTSMIKKFCVLSQECSDILEKASDSFHFSGRAIHRILKVSRTIADLAGSEFIEKNHLLEALQYRML